MHTGAAALEAVRSRSDIELLITDQAMPEMSGSELIAAVAAERPGLPAILATGYGEHPDSNHNVVHRLGKPFGQAALQRAVHAALARASDPDIA